MRIVPVRSNEKSSNGSAVASPSTKETLGELGGSLAGVRQQLGHAVDADHLADEGREGQRERSGAGAHVEGALVAVREHEPLHAVGKLRRPLVLTGRDQVGRPGEPVRRRRRHGGLGWVHC